MNARRFVYIIRSDTDPDRYYVGLSLFRDQRG
jgi:hypothetical protein